MRNVWRTGHAAWVALVAASGWAAVPCVWPEDLGVAYSMLEAAQPGAPSPCHGAEGGASGGEDPCDPHGTAPPELTLSRTAPAEQDAGELPTPDSAPGSTPTLHGRSCAGDASRALRALEARLSGRTLLVQRCTLQL